MKKILIIFVLCIVSGCSGLGDAMIDAGDGMVDVGKEMRNRPHPSSCGYDWQSKRDSETIQRIDHRLRMLQMDNFLK